MKSQLFKKAVIKTFFDNRGRLVIASVPNLPLIIWAAASFGGRFFWHSVLNVIAVAAIITWALLEIFWGVNYFRRALGAVVFLFTLWSRLH